MEATRKFTFQELLGEGGFGVVYLASMHSPGVPGQQVAVKLLKDPTRRALTRLQREARLLAASRHPAILDIVDLIQLAGRVALVTEYVPGLDLSSAIQQDLPEVACIQAIATTAGALHDVNVAAEAVLVHRDIKPSNIRLSRSGQVKLLDFGVAWSESNESTRGDSFVGSVPYMSPERLQSQVATAAGDVYSLGCTLFEALSREPLHPWDQSLSSIVQRASASQSEHDQHVHERLAGLILAEPLHTLLTQMLAYDPDARPTCGQVAQRARAVEPVLDGDRLTTWMASTAHSMSSVERGPLSGTTLSEAPTLHTYEPPSLALPVQTFHLDTHNMAEASVEPASGVMVAVGGADDTPNSGEYLAGLARPLGGTPVHDDQHVSVLFPSASGAASFCEAVDVYRRQGHSALRIATASAPHGTRQSPTDPSWSATSWLLDIANPGQTLMTAEVTEQLDGSAHATRSHGYWRPHEGTEPIEVHGLGASIQQPPQDGSGATRVVRRNGEWVAIRDLPRHLPSERDGFVGRDDALLSVANHLHSHRLVTLLGLGGLGKTRLALRYAWSWLGEWSGGVWFCDLTEATTLDGVFSAVSAALDVQLGRAEPLSLLGRAIAGRGRCLLLFDNCEQVSSEASTAIQAWLDAAPEAVVLTTSRQLLGLPGEFALPVQPMQGTDGRDLFVLRAKAARPDFQLDDASTADVDDLVRLLDGLPLALELAAARVRIMSPSKLLTRMSDRFRLLGSGRSGRHATLRATLDWSWDLLHPDEQSALAQLSVFEGGFTLEAAEDIVQLDEMWTMDAIQGLVEKSLVRQQENDRLGLLVSVQAYAADKLDDDGVWQRHGTHYALLGEPTHLDRVRREEGEAAWWAMSQDIDNLHIAALRAAERSDGDMAAALLDALWTVVRRTGPLSRASDLAKQLRDISQMSTPAACRIEQVLGTALHSEGQPDEGRTVLQAALARAQELGDRSSEGLILNKIGILDLEVGNIDSAGALFERAITRAQTADDPLVEASALVNLARIDHANGRVRDAMTKHEAGLALLKDVGDRRLQAYVLVNLGSYHQSMGNLPKANAYYAEGAQVLAQIGDRRGSGITLLNQGQIDILTSRLASAERTLRRAHESMTMVGELRGAAGAVTALAVLKVIMGEYDAAQQLATESMRTQTAVDDRRAVGCIHGLQGWIAMRQNRFEDARESYASALALHKEVGNQYIEAQDRLQLATLCHTVGERTEASRQTEMARQQAVQIEDRQTEAGCCAQQAVMLSEDGHHDQAITQAQHAVQVAQTTHNPSVVVAALCALAESRWRRGDTDAASSLDEARGAANPRDVEASLHLDRVTNLM